MNRTLPPQFVEMLAAQGMADVAVALGVTAPMVSVRLNPRKPSAQPISAAAGDAVPWHEHGYYLAERPDFTLDVPMHQGVYYVQEASSMAHSAAVAAAVALLGPGPLRYLDACAAPGGKTTAAADVLPPGSLLVANEYDSRRADILAENVAKWGAVAMVTNNDAARIDLPGFFDIIAADMPCSGEGMMRKEDVAVSQWSPALVHQCAECQWQIAANLWDSLAPGGCLIYSTCTFNTLENEAMVARMATELGAEVLPIPALDAIDGISGPVAPYDMPVYRFAPGRTRGEGLFLALLRKGTGHSRSHTPRAPRIVPVKLKKALLQGDWTAFAHGPALYALPTALCADAAVVLAKMRAISPGVELGTLKGDKLVPAQPLAMCTALLPGAFVTADVDRLTALAYLHRDAIVLPGDTPRGTVLLTYAGQPLGFVNNLGTRSNNLYPAPWRIRKAI